MKRKEYAVAKDTAFWLDCLWNQRGRPSNPAKEPRGANVCKLEGTRICALCRLADMQAERDALLAVARAAGEEHEKCHVQRAAGLKAHPCQVCDALAGLSEREK